MRSIVNLCCGYAQLPILGLFAESGEPGSVGFMAAKTADQTNAAGNELITFDTVITNVGGGYDSATSTFTAPSTMGCTT